MKAPLYSLILCCLFSWSSFVFSEQPIYSVGVANFQSNLNMAAQLNPILQWVGKRANVQLTMKSGYNFEEMQRQLALGAYDLYIGYPALQSDIKNVMNYQVIAALKGVSTSAIIVQQDAPYQQLSDLAGQEVVLGNQGVFFASVVPQSALTSQNITVVARVAGNQESVALEFKLGKHQAVASNLNVFKRHLGSSSYPYRVLWESPPLLNYPLLVRSDRIPAEVVNRIRQAFIDISQDDQGKQILDQVNQRPGIKWGGWDLASDKDYAFAINSYQIVTNSAEKRDLKWD